MRYKPKDNTSPTDLKTMATYTYLWNKTTSVNLAIYSLLRIVCTNLYPALEECYINLLKCIFTFLL